VVVLARWWIWSFGSLPVRTRNNVERGVMPWQLHALEQICNQGDRRASVL
jgi:hypothetical protein